MDLTENNTATLEFTHDFDGTTEKVIDKTHNYTFTIGGKVFGGTSQTVHELVKVGVNKDGTWDYETTKTTKTNGEDTPLGGATFGIYTSLDEDGNPANALMRNGKAVTCTTTTDDDNTAGLLTFSGLDEGTYYIKEESAPTGYVTQSGYIKVVIDATYEEVSESATVDDETLTYTTKVLKSYTVQATQYDSDGNQISDTSSTYTIDQGTKEEPEVTNIDSTTAGIENKKGNPLPSTGGMGTKILYTVGGILVAAACIVLVTRRKMQSK